MNYNEQMQKIVDRYRDAGEMWPATTREMAAWAIRNKQWEARGTAMVSICAEHLARAMREEYIKDPQGRTVRVKHAARIHQTVLWDDIRTASRDHMQIALQQRRQQIVGDCKQLKLDMDSYNENRNDGKQIKMIFDFTSDLEESELELETIEV